MTAEFSRRARRDLEEIFDYIAIEDPAAARRVIDAILQTADLLAARPHIGIRNARSLNLRSFRVSRYPYRLHYMIRERRVVIVHIRHAARQLWSGSR